MLDWFKNKQKQIDAENVKKEQERLRILRFKQAEEDAKKRRYTDYSNPYTDPLSPLNPLNPLSPLNAATYDSSNDWTPPRNEELPSYHETHKYDDSAPPTSDSNYYHSSPVYDSPSYDASPSYDSSSYDSGSSSSYDSSSSDSGSSSSD